MVVSLFRLKPCALEIVFPKDQTAHRVEPKQGRKNGFGHGQPKHDHDRDRAANRERRRGRILAENGFN